MPQPAPRRPVPSAPGTDPRSIRESLPAELVGEFDAEWALVMDRAKAAMELAGVQDLLRKWRHIAGAEHRSPGTHARVLAKAEEIVEEPPEVHVLLVQWIG